MAKKMLYFYIGFPVLSALCFFPMGFIGWFASYSAWTQAAFAVLCLSAVFLVTYIFIKLSFSEFPIGKNDELIFLAPYFVMTGVLLIILVLAATDVLWWLGRKYELIYILLFYPAGYSSAAFCGVTDFWNGGLIDYLDKYYYSEILLSVTIVLSAAHMAQIGLLMRKLQRQNAA